MPTKPSNKEEQLSLFPVEDNLQAATALITSKLPIQEENELIALLAIHHNTLISEIQNGISSDIVPS